MQNSFSQVHFRHINIRRIDVTDESSLPEVCDMILFVHSSKRRLMHWIQTENMPDFARRNHIFIFYSSFFLLSPVLLAANKNARDQKTD
jgi:hypothetical protein